MNKIASVVKRAQQLSKLTPTQRAIVKNASGLKKLATWVIKHPAMAKQLATNIKKASAKKRKNEKRASVEPRFTLDQALQIIGSVADKMYKAAQAKAAAEESEAKRLARILTKASELKTKK